MNDSEQLTPGEEVLERLRQRTPDGIDLRLPPRVFEMMEAEVQHYDEEARRLTVYFPVREAYDNPMGYMQGGMIVAAFDNVFGPLSYLVAPPSVTTQLDTSFVRPVTPREETLVVEAWVTEQTRSQLFMSAEARSPSGRVLALAHATCQIVRRR